MLPYMLSTYLLTDLADFKFMNETKNLLNVDSINFCFYFYNISIIKTARSNEFR